MSQESKIKETTGFCKKFLAYKNTIDTYILPNLFLLPPPVEETISPLRNFLIYINTLFYEIPAEGSCINSHTSLIETKFRIYRIY